MLRRLISAVLLAWALGFIWFAVALPQPADDLRTDGVVVAAATVAVAVAIVAAVAVVIVVAAAVVIVVAAVVSVVVKTATAIVAPGNPHLHFGWVGL